MESSPFCLTREIVKPGDKVFVEAENGFIWTTVTAVVLTDDQALYLLPTIPGALPRERIMTEDEFAERN